MLNNEVVTIEYGGVRNEVDDDMVLFRPSIEEIKKIDVTGLLTEKNIVDIEAFNKSKDDVILFGRRHPDSVQLKNILKVISSLEGVETIAIEGPPQLQPVVNAVLNGDEKQEQFLRKVVNYFATNHTLARTSEVPYLIAYLDIAKAIKAKQVFLVDTDFSWGPEPNFMGNYHYKLPVQGETSSKREPKMISLLQEPITQVGLKNFEIDKLFYDLEKQNIPEVMVGERKVDYTKKLATGKTVLLTGSSHTMRLQQHLSSMNVMNSSIMLPTNVGNNR